MPESGEKWRVRDWVCARRHSEMDARIEQVPNKPLLVKREIIMEITIQLPDDIADQLQERGMDLPRVALEKIAIEGAQSGELTDDQLRRLLGFETRMQVDAFLKSAGVYFDYTESDLAMDRETIEHLQTK